MSKDIRGAGARPRDQGRLDIVCVGGGLIRQGPFFSHPSSFCICVWGGVSLPGPWGKAHLIRAIVYMLRPGPLAWPLTGGGPRTFFREASSEDEGWARNPLPCSIPLSNSS